MVVSKPRRCLERKQRHVYAGFLLVASTLYAVKLLPASPVYFLIAVYVLYSLPSLIPLAISRKDLYIFVYTCLLISYVSSLAFIGVLLGNGGVLFQTYANILLGLSVIVIFIPGANLIDRGELASSSGVGLYGILVVNALDTIARITGWIPRDYEHSQVIEDNPDFWFYEYKFGGFMFNDSNQNGILIISILCLAFAILRVTGRGKMMVFLCLVLLAATFSRAAWAAGAVAVLLRLLACRPIAFRIAVIFILGSFLLVFSSSSFLTDDSMLSKIYIVRTTIELIERNPELLLFGAGLGQSALLLGIYGHVLPITALIETGGVGVLMYAAVILLFYFKGGYFVKIYVISVFIIAGFSSFIYLGAPCIFLPLVIIYYLEQPKAGSAYGPQMFG